MPNIKDGYCQVSFLAPKDLIARLERVRLETLRGVGEELIHAVERHVESPPIVVYTVPPLGAAAVEVDPTTPAPKRRGRRPGKSIS